MSLTFSCALGPGLRDVDILVNLACFCPVRIYLVTALPGSDVMQARFRRKVLCHVVRELRISALRILCSNFLMGKLAAKYLENTFWKVAPESSAARWFFRNFGTGCPMYMRWVSWCATNKCFVNRVETDIHIQKTFLYSHFASTSCGTPIDGVYMTLFGDASFVG